ncbi:O-acetyl-ADP-ribose deacetylase 1 [Rhizophagus clarus]|uniref:ADP-ribose 1''-phosphate phosphatase n=1 Tax=Rhizophagus clarus TaxID=94130 RepID=A0A8H3L1C8_9GLOM|nr:O-acetyl-ADP-ribose deacetylase 1 [Rhizophagus clarus]
MFTDQSFQTNANELNLIDIPNTQDFKMGKGIATIFKQKYNGVKELLNQHKNIGQVAILQRNNRYIFYIITKQKYYHTPTRENFELALSDLRRVCEELNVKHLCLPRIGAGLDKLPLEFVHVTIKKVFEGCDMMMTMFYFKR